MGRIPMYGSILAVLLLAMTAKGEIRCYCNKVDCVPTGYMCKSPLGICYSLVKYKDSNMDPAGSSVVHGCADTLEREPRIRTCAGQPVQNNEAELSGNGTESQTVTNSIEEPEPILVQNIVDIASDYSNNVDPSEPQLTCCTQDMCNYKDSVDIQISIGSQSSDRNVLSQERLDELDKPQKDLWFKAAVIAVPIAGGFILILLVLLAVRMLRSDSRQHRRLIQIRRERSLTKAQLYVTDHFIDKEKKQCSGDSPPNPQNNHSQVHHSHNHSHSHSHNPPKREREHSHVTSQSHRNSNSHHQHQHQHHHQHKHHKNNNCPKVTTNKDGYTYEQIVTQASDVNSNNCENVCQTSYPSIVVWGQSPIQNVAEVV